MKTDINLNETGHRDLSVKEQMIYNAVIRLIDAGADIHGMTVSDITGEAGIGKGTAYDYFKSKDEIIVKALIYNMDVCIGQLESQLCGLLHFRDKIFFIFDILENNFNTRRSFTQFLNLKNRNHEFGSQFREEFIKCKWSDHNFRDLLFSLILTARREGLIKAGSCDYFLKTAMMSQVWGFVLYLNEKDFVEDITSDQMKEFVYGCVLKTFSE